MQQRARYIIVSSREVIIITQTSPTSDADRNQWLDFENSLRIK